MAPVYLNNTNEKRAIELAQARYGKGTTVRHRMENGLAVWWVDHGQNDEAIMASNLPELIRLLTPASTAPNMGQEMTPPMEENLITTRQAAEILGVTPSAVTNMISDKRLVPAGTQPGKGGRHWLIRKADVEKHIGTMRHRARTRRKPVPAVTGGASVRPDKRGTGTKFAREKSGRQVNFKDVPLDSFRRAEALAAKIRSKSVFTEYVTATQVLRVAMERGLDVLEKEHAK